MGRNGLRIKKKTKKMNEIAKIQLFRIAATLPWAEVETTQHNIRLTCYIGSQKDAEKTVLVLNKQEAANIARAIRNSRRAKTRRLSRQE